MFMLQIFIMYEPVGRAQAAAVPIFDVINRASQCDPFSEEGLKPSQLNGDIAFDAVSFSYPTRQDRKALQGLSIGIAAGSSCAFVGPRYDQWSNERSGD
jgi:ATP-binding cassette subfamily B (MDR/TAP) protein 1